MAADNPDKYLNKIKLLVPLQSVYVNGLLEGLTSAIKSSKILDYKPVLDFVEKKVNSESFTNNENGERNYRRWLVSSITRLIDALVQTKPLFDFEKEDLLLLETIAITLLKNQDFFDDNENVNHSHLDQVLNSLQGQLLESLLNITTTWAEKFPVEGLGKKWNNTTEEYFTVRLVRNKIADKDFSIILGVYLSWFLYFDKDWVYTNANKIFDESNNQHLVYTLHGCFSGLFQKSRNVYDFLKANNVFSKAVEELTSKGREVDSLTTYALYEWHFLKIDITKENSILNEIFLKQNFEQLDSFVRESRITKWLNDEEKKTVIKHLLNIIRNKESLNSIYGKLLWLLEDINELNNEIADIVKIISQNLSNNKYHLNHYMKHVFKLADTNLLLAGNIITDILQSKQMIIPYDESLVVFVNKLYNADYNDIANEICITASDKNSLLLKKTYTEHN